MKRNRIGLFLTLILVGCSSACQLARGSNAIDESLLWFSRVDANIDRASELIETAYCPTCPTHLLSKEAALAWQQKLLQANEYEAKAYAALKAGINLSTGQASLTAQRRAEIESYLLALRGATALGNGDGLTSNASITLQPVLAAIEQGISQALKGLTQIKSEKADLTLEFQLSRSQLQKFKEIEARIQ